MENHPIPQDITGFQFKLVGNMTVRQFIYLAVGTVVAWLFFFILPLPTLIKWPLALISIGFGGALAFLPVDGRPMDMMFMNLLRAIFAPTQYIYDKTGGSVAPPKVAQPQIQGAPSTPVQPTQAAASPQTQLQTPEVPAQPAPIASPPPQTTASSQPTVAQVIPQPTISAAPAAPTTAVSLGWELDGDNSGKSEKEHKEETNKLIENEQKLEGEVTELKKELDQAKAEEKLSLGAADSAGVHQKAEELSKMLEQTIAQKAELEKELALLKANLQNQKSQAQTFTPSTATPLPQTQRVRQIPKEMEKTVGVVTQVQAPNLITGIVKDPRGNPLQNVLIEVKDTEDNPVRAFKTNALGQFASATSLSNGKYILTFEDTRGQNRFDSVEIEATGGELMPLEIISVDPREELRRELFN